MIKYLFFIIILGITQFGYSQVGIRAKYDANTFKETDKALSDCFETENIFASGFELGVDYWFRLEKRRIEFMPELYFANSKTDINTDVFESMSLNRIGFNFNVHLYPLDFEEDCNCPTFSKQGPGIQKGFFFHLSPGFGYEIYSMKTSVGDVNDGNVFTPKIGGGVGLDIGVNDFLTISPIYTYNYYFGNDWEVKALPSNKQPLIKSDTRSVQHQFAIRVGMRFNY